MMTADHMYKGPALVMWNMIADINLWGKSLWWTVLTVSISSTKDFQTIVQNQLYEDGDV